MDTINSNTSYPTESYGLNNTTSSSANSNSAGFLQPYKLQGGVTRSAQIIVNTDGSKMIIGKIPGLNAFGIAFYDSSGNLISTQAGATNTNYGTKGQKTVVTGLLFDGNYGTAYYDINGNLIQKIVGGTTFVYDPANNYTNITQSGLLPDGTGGFVAAKPGIAVSAIFS
jgi:hypothetical protein